MWIRAVICSLLLSGSGGAIASGAVLAFNEGTPLDTWNDGDEVLLADISAATMGNPPPFHSGQGADSTVNLSVLWNHDLTSISGDSILGATLSFGIWGHEPNLVGNQVDEFTIDGVDFTAQLNTEFENSVDGTTGETTYNVYSINLDAFPAVLSSFETDYVPTVILRLQGDQGGDPDNPFNGGWVTGSSLLVTTDAAGVPEPSTMLLLSGMGLFGLYHRRKQLSRETPEA